MDKTNAPTRLPLRWRVARTFSVAFLLVLLLMTFFENWLVYPIPPLDRADWSPEGIAYEDVYLPSEDGVELHGWYFPRENAKRAVLYLHGNGEQVADNGWLMNMLRKRLDASVLIIDYRGYGKSSGQPSERGLIADGMAAQRWLAEKTSRTPDQVVLIGRSIGGGVAVACAAELGAEALILQSTFTRLTDTAKELFPWLPVRWLMRNRFDSIETIDGYNGPLFASHGTDDRIVPFEQGQTLYETAECELKQFFVIDGGDHNDPQPRDYYGTLVTFLDALPTELRPSAASPDRGLSSQL